MNKLKVIVVGDLHLDSRPPASRSDDYEEQMFDKLNQIDHIARSKKIATVIQTGDVFNRRSISTQFLCRVMRHFKNSPVDYYAIAGNHDLPYGNADYLDRSPLSVLFSSGALNDLTSQNVLENVNFNAYHFSTELEIEEPHDYDDKLNVLVAHQYWDDYPNAENETIDKEKLSQFDFTILGHEHVTMQPKENVLIPGALSRMTAGNEDMDRNPAVFVVSFGSNRVERIELDVKPIEEAYDMRKIEKDSQKKDLDEFVSSIDQSGFEGGIDIRDLLKSLTDDDRILSTCEEYLRESGAL